MPPRRRKILWWALAAFMILIFVGPVVAYLIPRSPPGFTLKYELYAPSGLQMTSQVASTLKELYGASKVKVFEASSLEDKVRYLRAYTLLVPPSLALAGMYYPLVVMKDEASSVAVAAFSDSRSWLAVAELAEARGWLACRLIPSSSGLEYNCTRDKGLVESVLKELGKKCPLRVFYGGKRVRVPWVSNACVSELGTAAYEYLMKVLKRSNVTSEGPLLLVCSRGALVLVNATLPPPQSVVEPLILSLSALPRALAASYVNNTIEAIELPARAQIMILALCSSLR